MARRRAGSQAGAVQPPSAYGAEITTAGVIPTPAVAYVTRAMAFDAGLVISASHNPFQDNGIKVFGPDGYKLPDATELAIEEEIFRQLAASTAPPQQSTPPVVNEARTLPVIRTDRQTLNFTPGASANCPTPSGFPTRRSAVPAPTDALNV